MHTTDLIILFLAGISGIFFQYLIKSSGKALKLLLSFSGAYLLGLCFFHLIPEVYQANMKLGGLFIMGGFFIQIILEYLSGGVEHGHFHVSHEHKTFPTVVLISLCLHALIEGMPFGGHDHQHNLLVGVTLHKVPVSIVLMTMFLNAGLTKMRAFLFLLIFALMAPLGAVLFENIAASKLIAAQEASTIASGILIGILLHVSTTILFESSEAHRFNLIKFISIVVGVGMAFLAA